MKTLRNVGRGGNGLGNASGEGIKTVCDIATAVLHFRDGDPRAVRADVEEKIRAVRMLGDHGVVGPRRSDRLHLLVKWAVRRVRDATDDHGVCCPHAKVTATCHIGEEADPLAGLFVLERMAPPDARVRMR